MAYSALCPWNVGPTLTWCRTFSRFCLFVWVTSCSTPSCVVIIHCQKHAITPIIARGKVTCMLVYFNPLPYFQLWLWNFVMLWFFWFLCEISILIWSSTYFGLLKTESTWTSLLISKFVFIFFIFIMYPTYGFSWFFGLWQASCCINKIKKWQKFDSLWFFSPTERNLVWSS